MFASSGFIDSKTAEDTGKLYWVLKMGVLSFSAMSVENNICSDKDKCLATHMREIRALTHAALHVKCPLLVTDFNRNLYVSTN
jgi:hypothetical protein